MFALSLLVKSMFKYPFEYFKDSYKTRYYRAMQLFLLTNLKSLRKRKLFIKYMF